MIEAARQVNGGVSSERRHYASILAANPKRINEAAGAHWPGENGMHRVLNVTFIEDQRRAKVNNPAHKLAILCRIVLDLLHADMLTSGSDYVTNASSQDPMYAIGPNARNTQGLMRLLWVSKYQWWTRAQKNPRRLSAFRWSRLPNHRV